MVYNLAVFIHKAGADPTDPVTMDSAAKMFEIFWQDRFYNYSLMKSAIIQGEIGLMTMVDELGEGYHPKPILGGLHCMECVKRQFWDMVSSDSDSDSD